MLWEGSLSIDKLIHAVNQEKEPSKVIILRGFNNQPNKLGMNKDK